MNQKSGFPPDGSSRKGRSGLRHWLEPTLGLAAGLILFALVLITCVDVVGRYVLSAPLKGAFELTEMLVAALVFAALPLTTERREHVEVDLLAGLSKGRTGRVLDLFTGLFTAVVLTVFGWRLWVYSLQLMHDGAVTNALAVPLAPFGFFAAMACFISALIALYRGWFPLTAVTPPPAKENAT